MPLLGAHAVAYHDRHRSGKAQRAGAADDQNGNAAGQCIADVMPSSSQTGGDDSDRDDRRHKDTGTLSAILAMGALVAAASLTILMIWDRVVSSPTRVASQRRKPDWLTVAAET